MITGRRKSATGPNVYFCGNSTPTSSTATLEKQGGILENIGTRMKLQMLN